MDSDDKRGEEAPNEFLAKANLKIDASQLDEAIVLLDSALINPGSRQNEAEIYAAIGFCKVKEENYQEALKNYLNSIIVFKELKDKNRVAQMELNSATCFKIIGIYDRAANNAISAKQVMSKDSTHTKELALINNLLGNIHKNIGSYDKAIEYYTLSMDLRKKVVGLSLASPINNLGNNYFAYEKYDSALLFFTKYKEIAISTGNKEQLGRAYYNIGKTYFELDKLELAKTNIDLAQELFLENDAKLDMCALRTLKANYYLNLDINEAEKEAHIAYELSGNLGVLEEEMPALRILSEIYIKKGDYKEALKYSKLHNNISDEINIVNNSNKVYSYEMLSQLDVKNEEIEAIQQEQLESERESASRAMQRNFFIVFCLLSIGLIYVLYKRYLENKRFVEEYFVSETGVILKSGRKLAFGDIRRVETLRNDLVIYTNDGKITEKTTTLKSFIPSLPKLKFGQAQRGIVVNFAHIHNVYKTKFDFKEETINISINFRDDFSERWELYLKSK